MRTKRTKSNVLLAVLGVIFAACLLLTLVINNRTQEEVFWHNQQEKLVLITEKSATQLNDWVQLRRAQVEQFADDLQYMLQQDPDACINYIRMAEARNPDIQTVYLCMEDGGYYFTTWTPPQGYSHLEREWYQAAKAADGKTIFTEPYMDAKSGKLVLSCVKAVKGDGKIVGVAGADIDLGYFIAMVEGLKPSPNGGAVLVSPQGKIVNCANSAYLPRVENGNAIFHSIDELRALRKTVDKNLGYAQRGVLVEHMLLHNGEEVYAALMTIPTTAWQLSVQIPISDYSGNMREIIYNQMPIILLTLAMLLISLFAAFVFIRISHSQQDLQKAMEIAQAQSKTKSDFLSKMSHEMRTPMNAIIGMAKIADSTSDIKKLRYCLSTIEASSAHLLGIINDVLDMSKIEAGKFELENQPFNLEKTLMKTCNLIIEKTEQKGQKFEVDIGKNLCLNYIGDDLRLSQVITNLLSNAVKFTPEGGNISLSIRETSRDEKKSILLFEVKDTGIGMTPEQVSRLFQSFEQADGSISRRFGGTGLGLAILKSIVEKMNGRVWVESTQHVGSTFFFEIELERASHQERSIIFDRIEPKDLRILMVDDDASIRKQFKRILDSFGLNSDVAQTSDRAQYLVETAFETKQPYDIIFLDYDMPGIDNVDVIQKLISKIDKNTVIVITSFLAWSDIQDDLGAIGINHFVTKPMFPSAVLDAINDVVGSTIKDINIKYSEDKEACDFSGVNILLAEDVEINREIFLALLEHTGLHIDTAENGVRAVELFRERQDYYDMIVMDIQMPEMDGLEATRTIRALDFAYAKQVPIVAMTANAFKEDIDQCMESGMNDHLSKPIDEQAVIEKISYYTKGKGVENES